jgi:hypothetical protein
MKPLFEMSEAQRRFQAEGRDPSKLRLPVMRDWSLVLIAGIIGVGLSIALTGYVFMGVWTESIGGISLEESPDTPDISPVGSVERQLRIEVEKLQLEQAERSQLLLGEGEIIQDPSTFTATTSVGVVEDNLNDPQVATSTEPNTMPEGEASLLNLNEDDFGVQAATVLDAVKDFFSDR